jgi:hypothetical protein
VSRFRWLLAGLVLAPVFAGGAAAQSAPEFDIRIERDTRPRTLGVGTLSVSHRVTVSDRATGRPPEGTYVVYAQATNRQGEKSTFFACGHTNDVDSRTPAGVYDCTVIVDHGGAWDFVAIVSERQSEFPVPVAEASVPFDLATDSRLTGDGPGAGINGSVTDVALLVGHVAAAGGWFACVALLVVSALPRARRLLSPSGCHRLERQLNPIVKATGVTTGLVLGSGVYLTLTQTAYDAPFSAAAVDGVFSLPYGKPYFLTLVVKIALYVLMVAATVPLMREAQRRLRFSGGDAAEPSVPPLEPVRAGDAFGGGVACDVRLRPAPLPVVQRSGAGGRLGTAVVCTGAVGVALCVTLLKYFHELIEASRGLV